SFSTLLDISTVRRPDCCVYADEGSPNSKGRKCGEGSRSTRPHPVACLGLDEATAALPRDLLGRHGGGRDTDHIAGHALQGASPGDRLQVLQRPGCPPAVW